MRRPRLIVFAYACEPGRGSEPGAGWAWARMLASLGDVWVITRANNREAIEAVLPTVAERESLHFVYVDLPLWARRWKKGQRGVRLYYVLWQVAAVREARRLAAGVDADAVWHVTFANAWLGSLAPLVRLPFIYGPVGGGAGMPWRMLLDAPRSAAAWELARTGASAAARFLNPMARLAWSRARVILAQNPETLRWFPARHRDRATVMPNAVVEEWELHGARNGDGGPATAVFAGRLVYLKGAELAIRAVARTPDWHLRIFGQGPERSRLERLVSDLDVEHRVSFRGWVQRDELLREMRDADVFLFPSLHDQAPWVVSEALGCGLPVICCDSGGAPVIADSAGVAVRPTSCASTANDLADVLARRAYPASDHALRRARHFSRDEHVARLEELLAEARLR